MQHKQNSQPKAVKLYPVKVLKGYTSEKGKHPKGSEISITKEEYDKLQIAGVVVRNDPLTPVT